MDYPGRQMHVKLNNPLPCSESCARLRIPCARSPQVVPQLMR
jgi:hypothetical protein